jgi:predicted Zn finger-like uncharacterized protein
MILTCPACSTRYYADDGLIGPNGRSVRCAACGNTWFAEASLVLDSSVGEGARRPPLTREGVERMRRQAAPAAASSSAAQRFRQQQAERVRKERVRATVVTWGATGLAICATAAGAVAVRQDVAELWPESASAFTALGLDVNVYGLEIMELQVSRDFDGATPIVIVTGEVRNIGGDQKASPPLRLTLRDEHANPVFEIVQALPAGDIAPGAATPFSIRIENPPLNAVDLEASFAAPGEAVSAPASMSPAPAAPAPSSSDAPLSLSPGDEIMEEEEPHALLGDFGASLMPAHDPMDGRLG